MSWWYLLPLVVVVGLLFGVALAWFEQPAALRRQLAGKTGERKPERSYWISGMHCVGCDEFRAWAQLDRLELHETRHGVRLSATVPHCSDRPACKAAAEVVAQRRLDDAERRHREAFGG